MAKVPHKEDLIFKSQKLKLKKVKFKGESLNYIFPSWGQMGKIYFNLAKKILEANLSFDILVALAKGGWTWARAISDVLSIPQMVTFKLSFYDPKEPGIKLSKPILETPLSTNLYNKKVLLFDDVDDSGESLLWSKQYLSFFSPKSITTATLFHKPHSKITPDFFAVETDAWVIFPHEIREMIVGLFNRWKRKGLANDIIIKRLERIGFLKEEMSLFLKDKI